MVGIFILQFLPQSLSYIFCRLSRILLVFAYFRTYPISPYCTSRIPILSLRCIWMSERVVSGAYVITNFLFVAETAMACFPMVPSLNRELERTMNTASRVAKYSRNRLSFVVNDTNGYCTAGRLTRRTPYKC